LKRASFQRNPSASNLFQSSVRGATRSFLSRSSRVARRRKSQKKNAEMMAILNPEMAILNPEMAMMWAIPVS
jgi:hypothetical protein